MATQDSLMPEHRAIAEAPRDVEEIAKQERASPLPYWNATVAFQLGLALRTRLLTFEKPTVIHISTVSTPAHVLFHSVSSFSLEPLSVATVEMWRWTRCKLTLRR